MYFLGAMNLYETICSGRQSAPSAIDLAVDYLSPPARGPAVAFAPSPGAKRAAESTFPRRSVGTSKSSHRQILIVDDEPALRRLVSGAVTQAGFRADTAEDGEEGWEALCNTSYDLLITDHEMPRLNGLALIGRLRAISSDPPCILMSGSLPGPEPTLKKLVHPGAVLAKPFSPAVLIEKVYGLLLFGGFQATSPE